MARCSLLNPTVRMEDAGAGHRSLPSRAFLLSVVASMGTNPDTGDRGYAYTAALTEDAVDYVPQFYTDRLMKRGVFVTQYSI